MIDQQCCSRHGLKQAFSGSLSGFTVPQLDCIVETGTCDQPTIRTEGDMVDLFLMTGQSGDGLLDTVSGVIDMLW
jgi:hypothetical protein